MAGRKPVGKFRWQIEIQEPGYVTAPSGSKQKGWLTKHTMMADFEAVSGREYMADGVGFLAGQLTAKFTTHYRPGIDQSMRVVYKGEKYQISAVLPMDRNTRLEIIADRINSPNGD